MFRKPYKVKTSTTVKGSDRRRLRTLVENAFPVLSADDINSLIPNKGDMNQVKAMCHTGKIAMIFYSATTPTFFQIEDVCYPTLYTLWKFPKLLPTVTAVTPVLDRICNGADLMAPGVIVDESTISEIENLVQNKVCAIRLIGNKSPIAVGIALMSKDELCQNGIKGKAVQVVHTYKDTMWLTGDQQTLPLIPEEEIDEISVEISNININNDVVISEDTDIPISENTLNTVSSPENVVVEDCSDEVLNEKKEIPDFTMDEILNQSFMSAIKTSGKSIPLPILTSSFYSMYVLKACPPVLNLDIKKTTYKKLSAFLKKMQKEGVVQIKEFSKGVESIISIHSECQAVKAFSIDPFFLQPFKVKKEKSIEEEPSESIQRNYKFPCVTELHVVSANVKVLFEKFNIRKGESISCIAVRDVLRCYVKECSLQNDNNPREVILDPILADCVSTKGSCPNAMTWEDLQKAIVNKMPHAYQVEFEDKEPEVKKGKLEPIQVTVDTRTGNKKVTLIHNLETYGINPEKLSQHVQVAVAASTSLLPTQNGKGIIVLIQGNQVRYLQKLFLDVYKVPRKFLQGLENVPNKKK